MYIEKDALCRCHNGAVIACKVAEGESEALELPVYVLIGDLVDILVELLFVVKEHVSLELVDLVSCQFKYCSHHILIQPFVSFVLPYLLWHYITPVKKAVP